MTTIAPPVKQRLSRTEAAEYLGLSPASLAQDVIHGRLKIPMLKLGRRCVYNLADLDRWLAQHAVNTPAN